MAPPLPRTARRRSGSGFEDVLLLERLCTAVARINPGLPADVREEAIKQIQRLNSPELIANNEVFHRMLTEGIKVTCQERGNERGELVWLVDFANPDNNEFVVANQFQPEEGNFYEQLTDRRNVVVIADEAHRTQYGFLAKPRPWTRRTGRAR